MLLSLDHIQRLNLVALFDFLETNGRREAHAICKLQDALDLTNAEKESIELEQVNVEGRGPAYRWNPNKTLPVQEYNLAAPDIKRICQALDGARIVLGRDRWFRSLNAQLPVEEESTATAALNGELINA